MAFGSATNPTMFALRPIALVLVASAQKPRGSVHKTREMIYPREKRKSAHHEGWRRGGLGQWAQRCCGQSATGVMLVSGTDSRIQVQVTVLAAEKEGSSDSGKTSTATEACGR